MKIVPASSDDLGPIRDLLRAENLPYTGVSPYTIASFMVAKNEHEQVVAVIELDPYDKDGMLRSLAVSDEHHTSGVHEQILAAAENHAIALGLERLYILAHTKDKYLHGRGYVHVEKSDLPASIAETPEFHAMHTETTECLKLDLKG